MEEADTDQNVAYLIRRQLYILQLEGIKKCGAVGGNLILFNLTALSRFK